jgi:NAD(P)-dependent dehydrogenase (short-subunit alcohol dehydrogenase family)
MTQSFASKTILVTGGSKGIGLACAKTFLEAGAAVAIASRSQANIDDALKNLPGAIGFAADLTNEESAAALIGAVEAKLGPIDILINSAGAARRTPPADLTPAAYRAAMDAKFFSYINITDPLIKRMGQRQSGVIINIIGAGGKIASPTHIAGGSANAALMLATAGLAQAYAGQNIRVIGINPGLTETSRVSEGMTAEAKLQNITQEEARTRAIARIPIGRMATPQDIANTALFLASEAASYITGITLTMDGATTASVV